MQIYKQTQGQAKYKKRFKVQTKKKRQIIKHQNKYLTNKNAANKKVINSESKLRIKKMQVDWGQLTDGVSNHSESYSLAQ